MIRRAPAALVGTLLVLVPASAHAHLVNTGLGPVYDGISHLFLSFDDLLPAVAMALLGGLNGKVAARRALFALPGAWLAGGIAGYTAGVTVLPAGTTSLSLLALGILVAADRRLAPGIVTFLAIAVGLLHGWLNGAGIASAGNEALALAGIGTTVFVVVALVAAFVSSLEAGWTRVAVRVAGSWVAAIGLLMLGWGLRGAP